MRRKMEVQAEPCALGSSESLANQHNDLQTDSQTDANNRPCSEDQSKAPEPAVHKDNRKNERMI